MNGVHGDYLLVRRRLHVTIRNIGYSVTVKQFSHGLIDKISIGDIISGSQHNCVKGSLAGYFLLECLKIEQLLKSI